MKVLSIFALSIIIIVSCDPNNQKLVLENNTNDTIYYRVLYDTLLYERLHLYKLLPNEKVMPNLVMGKGEGVWEYRINHESRDSSLHIFIFMDSELEECIINEKKYITKGFSVKLLEEKNWLLRYPADFSVAK